jgi:hypothetical protein
VISPTAIGRFIDSIGSFDDHDFPSASLEVGGTGFFKVSIDATGEQLGGQRRLVDGYAIDRN